MKQAIYEGTWEEIASHASELTGRRVRLTVEVRTPPCYSLAEALKGKVGIIDEASLDLSNNTGQKFAELMQEKYSQRGELS